MVLYSAESVSLLYVGMGKIDCGGKNGNRSGILKKPDHTAD